MSSLERLLLVLSALSLGGCAAMVPSGVQRGTGLSLSAVSNKALPPNYHAHQVGEASERFCDAEPGATERVGLADKLTEQALAKGGDFIAEAKFSFENTKDVLNTNSCVTLTGKIMALDNGTVAEDEALRGRDPASMGRLSEVVNVSGNQVEITQHTSDHLLETQKAYDLIDAQGEKRGTVQIEKVDGTTAWGSLKDGKAFWGWSVRQP